MTYLATHFLLYFLSKLLIWFYSYAEKVGSHVSKCEAFDWWSSWRRHPPWRRRRLPARLYSGCLSLPLTISTTALTHRLKVIATCSLNHGFRRTKSKETKTFRGEEDRPSDQKDSCQAKVTETKRTNPPLCCLNANVCAGQISLQR